MTEPERPCPFEESASAWALEALSGEELARFEAHIASCERCRSEAEAMRGLVRRMRELPAEAPRRDLAGAILQAVRAGSSEELFLDERVRHLRSPKRILALCIGAAAAACLLAALAVWRYPGRAEREPAAAGASPREVEQAVRWLLSAQEPTGEWDAEKWGGQENYTVGLTGLAVLALVGDARGLDRPRAQAVARAVRYLVSRQGPGGRIGPATGGVLYNHGIATVALLEVYGATRDGALRPVIDRALAHMTLAQNEAGGWGYGVDPGERPNTAVTTWQVHALLLAGSLGWEEAGRFAERGLAWLRSMLDAEGTIGYRAPRDFPYGEDALAAMAGFLLLASSPEERAAPARAETGDAALARLAETIRRSASRGRGELDYYRSYFLSYAIHAAAGGEAARLADALREPILRMQVRSGPHSGSWEPADRWSLAGGRVYATAMAALSLQADSRAPRLIGSIRSSRAAAAPGLRPGS